jgi:ABC-type lipoprotein export system ATPase subunit
VDLTVANLSEGEHKGIAIGRANQCNANLIVADESTVALLGVGDAELKTIMLN